MTMHGGDAAGRRADDLPPDRATRLLMRETRWFRVMAWFAPTLISAVGLYYVMGRV